MKNDSMDEVFAALSSPLRRRMLDVIKSQPGCCVNDVCAHFQISRIGVMKHLKLLEKAQLLTSEKQGRSRRMYINTVPIQLIYDRWTTEYSAMWASGLTRLKYKIESKKKGKRHGRN